MKYVMTIDVNAPREEHLIPDAAELADSIHVAISEQLPGDVTVSVGGGITEAQLVELLIGPTSGGNAKRLAAYAFGRGAEYDENSQGWKPGTEELRP